MVVPSAWERPFRLFRGTSFGSAYCRKGSQSATKGSRMSQETKSVNDIRTAIRELSARAELARKEGRPDDAAELEQRVDGYRRELAAKP